MFTPSLPSKFSIPALVVNHLCDPVIQPLLSTLHIVPAFVQFDLNFDFLLGIDHRWQGCKKRLRKLGSWPTCRNHRCCLGSPGPSTFGILASGRADCVHSPSASPPYTSALDRPAHRHQSEFPWPSGSLGSCAGDRRLSPT